MRNLRSIGFICRFAGFQVCRFAGLQVAGSALSFAKAYMQCECMSWIEAVSAQSLRRSLNAVGVHGVDSNSLCTESSLKPTCSGSSVLRFKQPPPTESSANPPCSVSACLGLKQSLRRVFVEPSMQWECMAWIQTVSAQSLR